MMQRVNLIIYFDGLLQLRDDWQDTRCWLWKHLLRLKLKEMTLPLSSGQEQIPLDGTSLECSGNHLRLKHLNATSQERNLIIIGSDLAVKIKVTEVVFLFVFT